jgi:hypothetical protein
LEGIELGMSDSRLRELRPAAIEDGAERVYDPSAPASFRIGEGKVLGVRVLVPAPASDALLRDYEARYKSRAVVGSPYTYLVDNQSLRLYSVANGVELVYGADPGPVAKIYLDSRSKEASPNRGGAGAALRPLPRRPKTPPPPEGLEVGGAEVWVLPLKDASPGASSLVLILGTGATDDETAARGATAAVAAWILERVGEVADPALVAIQTDTFRSATVFEISGLASEVQRAGDALAKALARLAKAAPTPPELERAYQASFVQSAGATIERRLLEDEALGALLPGSVFTASPVDRARPMPKPEQLLVRMRAVAKAPMVLIATGDVTLDAAREIARAAGERPRDTRPRSPRPQLPNRVSRRNADLALAIDGFWVPPSDARRFALLSIAESWVAQRGLAQLLGGAVAFAPPLAVVGGGQLAANYLFMVSTAPPALASELDATARETMAQLRFSPPSGRAFEAAREAAYGALLRDLSTPEGSARRLAAMALARLPPGSSSEVLEDIAAATEAEFAEWAGNLKPERGFTLRWGPQE